MREAVQRFHNDVLEAYNKDMFITLIHPHNVVSEGLKMFTFENMDGEELPPLKGYLAAKERKGRVYKYFIDENQYEDMPVRVNSSEELYMKESSSRKAVIWRPVNYNKFRIVPEQTFATGKEFIDSIADFEHTNPKAWKAMKFLAVMGIVGKTFTGISTPSEFGKSGIFNTIHGLTQKSIVYQPRTEAGVLLQINEDGNMVFDEICDCEAKVKKIVGAFTLTVADNRPTYINGAVKAVYLKQFYDITQQSLTFIYNIRSYYKEEEDFFDKMFGNNPAIHSRMLKFRFDGNLTESFRKDFNIRKVAEENKMFYIRLAKYILWLKELRMRNAYTRRFKTQSEIINIGRKRLIYDEITWLVDFCSANEKEYADVIHTLDKGIKDYNDMAGDIEIGREDILEFDEKAKVYGKCNEPDCSEFECNEGSDGKPYCRRHLK